MPYWVTFRFYGDLNDFLSPGYRQRSLPFKFDVAPAVKDTIESFGVPHVEVRIILINQQTAGFDYIIQPGDYISVFPEFGNYVNDNLFERSGIILVNGYMDTHSGLNQPCFIADGHLGKLVKYLRMLGVDVRYHKQATDEWLIRQALTYNRILLTRDFGLLRDRRLKMGHYVRYVNWPQQVIEIVHRFRLMPLAAYQYFSRCLKCNVQLKSISKEQVKPYVPQKVWHQFEIFYTCCVCGRFYWPGGHYRRMRKRLNELLAEKYNRVAYVTQGMSSK